MHSYSHYQRLLAAPGLRLLRFKLAPLFVCFLQQEFRGGGERGSVGTRPQERLVAQLAELLQAHAPFCDPEESDVLNLGEDFSTRARRYLEQWANDGLLIRGQDDTGQEWYDLTPTTGKTLLWLDTLENPSFVATESRFLDILHKLRELVQNNAADKETRLADLHRRQAQLADEIRALEGADELPTYTAGRIEWEVANISQLGKSLREDFRNVDENFQALIKSLYERQLQGTGSRGQTLGFALDSLDTIRQQDQGRSFYTFWEFLTDPAQQAELDALLKATSQLLNERELPTDEFLGRLQIDLFEAARLVRDTSLGLTERLHRIITELDPKQRQRARAAYQAIQKLALQARTAEVSGPLPGLTVPTRPMLGLPLARPLADSLHEPPPPAPNPIPTASEQSALLADDLAQLFAQRSVDRRRLTDNIAESLSAHGGQATLLEVIHRHPLTQGFAEALTYLALAAREPRHRIDASATVLVPLDAAQTQALRLPLITFLK